MPGPSVLAVYTGVLAAGAGAGLVYAMALGLLHVSQWMETYPARARATHLGLVIPVLAWTGHVSLSACMLCWASTLYSTLSMAHTRWPLQRPKAVWRYTLGLAVPLVSHAVLTRMYRDAQHAWVAQAHIGDETPPFPHADPMQVVALIAGLVWVLPVYQWVSETTQAWSLPN